jgi:hypothetical protein
VVTQRRYRGCGEKLVVPSGDPAGVIVFPGQAVLRDLPALDQMLKMINIGDCPARGRRNLYSAKSPCRFLPVPPPGGHLKGFKREGAENEL